MKTKIFAKTVSPKKKKEREDEKKKKNKTLNVPPDFRMSELYVDKGASREPKR